MAGRERRASPSSAMMPGPGVLRRSERASTPSRSLGRGERAPTPARFERAPTPARLERAPTPARSSRATSERPPSPTGSISGRRSLKTMETQTVSSPSQSKRPSLSLPPPPTLQRKRLSSSSSLTARAESPGRALRNGRQRPEPKIMMVDGIPVPVKRTRSLVSIESDSSSVFNDTASAIDGYMGGGKSSDLAGLLEGHSVSASNSPRRGGRASRLSESSSLTGSPLPSPVLPKQGVVKRKNGTGKSPARAGLVLKKQAPGEGKKKRGAANTSPEVPVKKTKAVKKEDTDTTSATVDQSTETVLSYPPKPISGPLGRKIEVEGGKRKTRGEGELKKQGARVVKRTPLSNGSAKARKTVLAAKKTLTRGQILGRGGKITEQLARQITNATRARAVKAMPAKQKPVPRKPVKRLGEGKKDMTGEVNLQATQRNLAPMTQHSLAATQQKLQQALSVKMEEMRKTRTEALNKPGTAAQTSGSGDLKRKVSRSSMSEDASTATHDSQVQTDGPNKLKEQPKLMRPLSDTGVVKKQLGAKSSTVSEPTSPLAASQKKTVLVGKQTQLDGPVSKKLGTKRPLTAKEKSLFMKNKVAGNSLDTHKIDPIPAPPAPPDTLKTLTQVSQILKKYATESEDSSDEKVASAPVTPTKAPASLPPAHSAELNGTYPEEEAPQDASHVSPINTLANKLRKKLISSPEQSVARTAEKLLLNLPVVPIINSLTDAAKQMSSFKHSDEGTQPKESQWKVNKTIIYQKITGKRPPSLDGTLSPLLRSTPGSPGFGSPAAASEQVFSDGGESSDYKVEVKEAKTNGDIEQEQEDPPVPAAAPLDSNENQLKTDDADKPTDTEVQTPEKEVQTPDKEVQTPTGDADAQLPEETSDNHSSPEAAPAAAAPEAATSSSADKTVEKEIVLNEPPPSADSGVQIDTESDLSNSTQNSDSPPPKPSEPAVATDIDAVSLELGLPLTTTTSTETAKPSKEPKSAAPAPAVASSSKSSEPTYPLLEEVAARVIPLPYEEEDMEAKVSVLGALGLQSKEQAKAPKVPKLRLVIRPTLGKKHRRSANHDVSIAEKTYTVCREGDPSGEWERSSPSKSRDPVVEPVVTRLPWYPRMPISNGNALETLSDATIQEPGVGVGDGPSNNQVEGEKSSENLVIPEKSSSFAIHPGRLCEDVCCYCHNKFGLYDTPLHVAQIKGDDKQRSVLAREPFLTFESCLCDACFRHLDRPGPPKGGKPSSSKSKPQPNQACSYKSCNKPAAHAMMRKWKRKVRSQLREECVDHKASAWLCENHYSELARVGACSMCKRRLTSQQMYHLEATAAPRLTKLLRRDGMPITLDGNSNLCKKCRYYASLRVRSEDHTQLNSNNKVFLREHRTRVLKSLNIEPSSLPDVFAEPAEKPKKQPKKKATEAAAAATPPPSAPSTSSASNSPATGKQKQQAQSQVKVTPTNRKVQTPVRSVGSGGNKISPPNKVVAGTIIGPRGQVQISPATGIKLPSQTKITVHRPIAPAPPGGRNASATITRATDKSGDLRRVATQNASSTLLSRLGLVPPTGPSLLRTTPRSTPQVTIEAIPPRRSSAMSPPTEQRDVPNIGEISMNSRFEFQPVEGNSTWQKVNATFQFDGKTRQMWHQLHAPYGSYTSFLRHLVLLESYWRNGDLALAPGASTRARHYLNSVQNRIQAYEGVSSETDNPMGSVPLISEVRSLAASAGSAGWSTDSA